MGIWKMLSTYIYMLQERDEKGSFCVSNDCLVTYYCFLLRPFISIIIVLLLPRPAKRIDRSIYSYSFIMLMIDHFRA